MTIEELRVIVTDVKGKAFELYNASEWLYSLANSLDSLIATDAPYVTALNVDTLVSIYAPLYTSGLTRVETAADALGSDVLH